MQRLAARPSVWSPADRRASAPKGLRPCAGFPDPPAARGAGERGHGAARERPGAAAGGGRGGRAAAGAHWRHRGRAVQPPQGARPRAGTPAARRRALSVPAAVIVGRGSKELPGLLHAPAPSRRAGSGSIPKELSALGLSTWNIIGTTAYSADSRPAAQGRRRACSRGGRAERARARQATQQQGVQWLADAVGLIPDEAAPAADRHALLAAASAIAAHGQNADSSKCAPARPAAPPHIGPCLCSASWVPA